MRSRLLCLCAVALCLPTLAAVAGSVTQTNIVANKAVYHASVTDPTLLNPWGISTAPGGPFWISDNGNGTSPIYGATGGKLFSITVPPPAGGTAPSTPTGQVYNPTTEFALGASGPATFLFATEDGTLSGWNGGASGVLAVDNSKKGAVYKGLAMAVLKAGPFLLAANFHSGQVEVYNGQFKLVGSYRSPTLPGRYGPFNVAVLGTDIFITYALTDAARHDDVAGPGHGFLDQVTLGGAGKLTFKRRIQAHGPLNSPWGLAIAPATFGPFKNALLVGNFGDGRIHAYAVATGALIGTLLASKTAPLTIDGLWALFPGNGGSGGAAGSVYFTAGPNHEADGLLGSLTFVKGAAEFGE